MTGPHAHGSCNCTVSLYDNAGKSAPAGMLHPPLHDDPLLPLLERALDMLAADARKTNLLSNHRYDHHILLRSFYHLSLTICILRMNHGAQVCEQNTLLVGMC